MPELRKHAGRHYAVRFRYALPDNAWAVELSEAVPAPDAWAHMLVVAADVDGRLQVRVLIGDEGHQEVRPGQVGLRVGDVGPYQIMRWFMEQVTGQVERCRIAYAKDDLEAVE
ncbi:hypothetical protein [Streptacidiphilus fuscans]|uniref:Uncharacterized protein n=1 Tax=Streptacidiphilus fuscans TaxID=2789292 RepID=A0A931BE08_9ACTN|nr:hypothetical protein [Streptacidiphilus fuscans]MBF9073906.1 hypothetical protein [Streptacidiphilus fuscans]